MVDSRLNQWQREVAQLSETVIRETDTALQREYKTLLKKIKKDANEALKHPENLTRTGIMRQERRLAIARQIQDDLRESHPLIRETVTEGVKQNTELGYYGNWYEMEQSNDIQINMHMLDTRKLEQIATHPVEGKRFSERLYDNREQLGKQVNRALINGIEHGLGYREIANEIESAVDGNYKRALRIARTESMRANSEARNEANLEAQKIGVQFQKQWLATLDSRTRDSHQEADGQLRDPDDDFEVNGYKGPEPRMIGVASEDIECRCTTINIVGGIAPDTRMARNIENNSESVEFENYVEWKEFLELRHKETEADKVLGAISGALNDRNDPNETKRKEHASRYYEAVRNSDPDPIVERVSRNAQITREEAEKIRQHIFINKYDLAKGYGPFDPDYDMAQSWQRLSSNGEIHSHDVTMIHHELIEHRLMNEEGLSYNEAHKIANQSHNYFNALMAWKEERGE